MGTEIRGRGAGRMTSVRSAALIALLILTVLASPAGAATGKPSGPGKGNPYPPGQTGKCETSEEHGGCPPGSKGKPKVVVFSNSAESGEAYEAEGSGFLPASKVDASVDNRVVESFATDRNGAFKAALTIPAGTEAGAHTVKFKGTGADGEVIERQMPLVVTGPELINTASPSATLTVGTALLALMVLAGFAALMVRVRSRRIAAEGV